MRSDEEDTIEAAGRLLPGGGETGRLLRAGAWAESALGQISGWPQSLRSALSVCLGSRFPIVIYWGPELITFYNDAYAPILANKHPWALGRPCRVVWAEIWDVIGPQLEGVLATGDATWSDDRLLVLHRHGYPEECYFSFSFGPIRDERGAVGGVFTAVTENTQRVIGQRRLDTLRDLASRSAEAKSVDEACRIAAETLGRNPWDVPFSLLYRIERGTGMARLVGASGLAPGASGAPERVRVDHDDEDAAWPLADAARARGRRAVQEIDARVPDLPGGPWDDPATRAVVAAISARGDGSPVALLVAGVSPRRGRDSDDGAFFELVAGQVARALASADAYEAESRRAAALAELDRAKTAFFNNVSHEFRTPLTLISGPIDDALADDRDALPASQRTRLEVARRGAVRLRKLVDTLLDFSRLEAGRADAAYEPTDLATFTADLASVFRSAIERAGLRLVVDCPSLADDPVWVDRGMWEKIVFNLLSNAFKFTFEGGVAVALRRRGDRAELTVRDSGVGIAEADVPRVFDRFHRVRGTRARSHEGTGIGLALVQELVRLHGGTIDVASAVDVGTTFTVTVPFGTAHLPADRLRADGGSAPRPLGYEAFVDEALRWLPEGVAEHGAPDPDSGTTGDRQAARAVPPLGPSDARILVADDNADMRGYLARLLGACWSVDVVADGHAMLASVRERRPDLVIADVMMPGLDGFELVRALRADPATRALPIVLLSARAGEEARVGGLAAGADDYLVKPFAARELVARVGAQLALARVRDEARAAAELANRTKDEFLAMLGHELRNPLAAVRNAIVSARLDRSRTEHALEIATRGTDQLAHLIDDLLDVARITQGRIALRLTGVSITGIVQRAVESTRSLVHVEERVVRVKLPDEDVLVEGDPVRLEQVLVNLLGNAVKYSDLGDRIDVSLERDGPDVAVRVRDDGVGIPPDILPRVFDLFVQADGALYRARGGLGIGLTLVKRIVELHGGRVEARSAGLGQGAEFVVRLPALRPHGSDSRVPAASDRPPVHRPARIVVVDDNTDAAESLTMLLELLGHDVAVAHDGPTAIALAQNRRPDVMLVDIGLPGIDGYDVARAVRRDPDLARTFLVALTGYGRDEDRTRALAAGFDRHFAKPIDVDELTALVAEVADRDADVPARVASRLAAD
ncbi:MAG TPA: ATP-binding protein [Candidatus Binatia bacterium]|nr:ATP-binding protein [Candidatus Binatia bacterium]